MIMMVISILLVSALLGWVFSRKVLKPIGGEPLEAATIALSVAEGRLSNVIDVKANDRSSLFFALHTMQSQLRQVVGQIKDASDSVRQGARKLPAAASILPRVQSSKPPHWNKRQRVWKRSPPR